MIRSLLSKLRGRNREDPKPSDDSSDESGASSTDSTASNDLWEVIPSWQYDGRHVESGGVTRDEQERALEDIQRQAAEIERSEGEQPDPES